MALGVTVGIVVGTSSHGTPKLRSTAANSGNTGVSSTAVEDTCDIIVPGSPADRAGAGHALPAHRHRREVTRGHWLPDEQTTVNLGAFVQATILNTQTGAPVRVQPPGHHRGALRGPSSQ